MAIPKVIINNLYKHTALESSFSVNMLAIDHGRPKLLSLKDAITSYIEHRREVVLRRTRFLLNEAEVELLEKLKASSSPWRNIDDFIRIIRDSRDRDDAKAKLVALTLETQGGRTTRHPYSFRSASHGRRRVQVHRKAGRPHPRSPFVSN